MDERLKQRLVGAAVIIALAAIFIPMILEGPDDDMGPIGSNLPEAPEYVVRDRVEPLVLPPPPETEAPAEQPPIQAQMQDDVVRESVAQPEAPEPETPSSPEPAVTQTPSAPADKPAPAPAEPDPASPEISGWIVQVGSFGKQSNALALRDRLREKGYTTFVEQATTDEGTTYRVRVGPELERSAAERHQAEIAETFDLKGIVTQYP